MQVTTSITVKYKHVDGWHVFESEDLPGLYVASKDAEIACGDIAPSIEKLIELDTGLKVKAEAERAFSDFLQQIQETASAHASKPARGRRRITRQEFLDFAAKQKTDQLVLSDKRFSVRPA